MLFLKNQFKKSLNKLKIEKLKLIFFKFKKWTDSLNKGNKDLDFFFLND